MHIMNKFSRKLIFIIALSLYICCQDGYSADQKETRPNFIVMIADDLGWNDLGCYGHQKIQTPHIDSIANKGLTFDNAFLTISSCSPSRCSILTGRYPHNTGAGELHLPLPENQTTVAHLLQESGYYTAAAGKWHLGNHPKSDFNRIYQRGGPSGCGEWVKSLNEAPDDKPFFLWLAASDPHRGYAKNIIPTPHTKKDIILPPFIPDTSEIRDDFALYYDEVSRFDKFVGDVFTRLKEINRLKNTLIIIMSDNGRPFPRSKTTLYDSGIKTPFVTYFEKLNHSNERTDSLVSSIDIAPTFLELARISPNPDIQGVSFVPILKDPSSQTRQFVFAEHNWHDYQARERSVRSDRFLYIRNDLPALPLTPPADAVNSPTWKSMRQLLSSGKLTIFQYDCFITPRPTEQLFDVYADPFQLRNLADNSFFESEKLLLRNELEKWVTQTKDTWNHKTLSKDGFHRVTGKKLIPKAHPSFGQ